MRLLRILCIGVVVMLGFACVAVIECIHRTGVEQARLHWFDGYNIVAYSEPPAGTNHLLGGTFDQEVNLARGVTEDSSANGLFRPNKDIYFWTFQSDGSISTEAKFHVNNVGLMSSRDYSPKRQGREFRIVVLGNEHTAATTASVSWPDHLWDDLNADRELVRRFGSFKVYNFGHLDTSLSQWGYVLERRALRFDPDLVIVNVVDYHLIKRWPDVFPNYEFKRVSYTASNGEKAWTWIHCARNGRTLRDPDCVTGKILSFYMSPRLAHDKEAVASILQQVKLDMASASVWTELALTALSDRYSSPRARPSEVMSEGAVVQNAVRDLRRITDNFPSTLVIVNPWLGQVMGSPYLHVPEVSTSDPELRIVDTRRYMPSVDQSVVDTWYHKEMREKWAPAGHKVYAAAVARVIKDRLDGKQPLLVSK